MVEILRSPTNAVKRFGFNGSEWQRPKPKTLFFAQFVLSDGSIIDSDVMNRLPLMVRTVDRPQFSLTTNVHNQYNKSRVVHGRIKYHPVRIIFYDDVNNTALKVFNQYRKFYYGDFQDKDMQSSWNYETLDGFENNPKGQNWGLSVLNNKDRESSYFFKRVDIFEFYNDQFTVFNLIHPKINSFEMDPRDITEEAISETMISVDYEGVTHQYPGITADGDLINAKMTQEIADLIGIEFSGGFGFGPFKIPNPLEEWTDSKEIQTILDIFGIRNPAGTVSDVLRSGTRNIPIPASFDQTSIQSSVISGVVNSGTNKVTNKIKSIFG